MDARRPDRSADESSSPFLRLWPAIAVLLGIAATLRVYHPDGQLWLDEVSALRGYKNPFLETITKFPIFFPNPLYELMAHASLLAFGVTPWAIRLPAALFGVAGVLAFYKLARRTFDPGTALLGSGRSAKRGGRRGGGAGDRGGRHQPGSHRHPDQHVSVS